VNFRVLTLLGLSLALFSSLHLSSVTATDVFSPTHRVSGVGIERDDLSKEVLTARTNLMIESQTFGILREPLAVVGAKRITSPKLQELFQSAGKRAGVAPTLVEAIAYLESWGDANAESPAGPRGIMQISRATAQTMGLRVVTSTRYKTTRERLPVKVKGKTVVRTVTRRTPYTVVSRDDRMNPSRAVPAAAMYLAGMIRKYGGEDWAVFAYHCGQGCVNQMMDLTRSARGIPKDEITVPRMFFSNSPSWNRELYDSVQAQMQRDYSPTYYFRIMRAQQLLAMYRKDPAEFTTLAQQFHSEFPGSVGNPNRASDRLTVWLKRDDLRFRSCEAIRTASGKALEKAFNRPEYFGYALDIKPDSPANLEYFQHASPSALGTLSYIAYETRRLYEAGKPKDKFVPLPVTSLVETEDHARLNGQREAMLHCSGEVFDVDYASLPPREVECLRFVLSDLGWGGFLGFVEEGKDSLHIGCSPTSRDFFAGIFREAVGPKSAVTVAGSK
jgi:hypothetical protein